MEHHAIYRESYAVVRRADNGISNLEWHHGCRVIQINYKQELMAQEYVRRLGYELLDNDAWNEYISSLDEPIVPSNNFISTKVSYDKWEQIPIIY